jgi:hypothetical protein
MPPVTSNRRDTSSPDSRRWWNRYRDLAKKVDARGHLIAAAQLVAEPALG